MQCAAVCDAVCEGENCVLEFQSCLVDLRHTSAIVHQTETRMGRTLCVTLSPGRVLTGWSTTNIEIHCSRKGGIRRTPAQSR